MFESWVNSTTDSVFYKMFDGKDFRYRFVNKVKADRFRTTPEEMFKKTNSDFMSAKDAEIAYEEDMRAYNGETINCIKKIVHIDGRVEFSSIVKSQWKDSRGNVFGILGTARDVTRQMEIEECMRTYFSETIHSLKTKYIGYQVLRLIANGRYGAIPNTVKTRLDGITCSFSDVENMLIEALARVKSLGFEEKKLGLDEAPVDVGLQIIDKVLSSFASEIEEKNIFIDNTYGSIPEKQVFLKINATALYSIFENLISNAIKYVQFGGVIAIGYIIKDGKIIFNVYNNGPGISEEFQRNGLFEKFQRDEGTQNLAEGTGIGLYHAKKMAELLGGSLIHEPTNDNHPNFLLTLPIIS
ncbi:MAG: PAS sensor protein [Candidatus Moranbacteria bacterium GW2011_GWE1_36_7]|nr:MAG: PAS sensor protein [Candidatus Moranbacteria bacterium GW2011_GWD2_36_12]KKQ06561.1 MAG: PAS sensor protein [Candidatus Moranbacteria bacterium GW2011_GWE2_36_40]KKQ15328.1 MAG: PAS sensor protein [Candidatus Moranbacteria bacterium GW2011_GWE1_36_7]